MKTTESVFRESEFNLWAQRAKLDSGERYMISRYLNPEKITLEAGAGGGRILLAMQSMGFNQLNGFDFLPEFIEVARQRDQSGKINYQVQDGRNLNYPNNSFDQLIYLQQLVRLVLRGVFQLAMNLLKIFLFDLHQNICPLLVQHQ